MDEIAQKQLSAALLHSDKIGAALVLREDTEVTEVPTDFLNRYRIFYIKYFNPAHPVVFYVGAALPHKALRLTGNLDSFVDMIKDDEVIISSSKVAVNYVVTFLNTTRSMQHFFNIIDDVNAIQFLPVPTEIQKEQIAVLHQKYALIITPPVATEEGNAYHVTCFVVVERELLRINARVGRAGQLNIDSETLENNMPVVFSV